MKLLIAYDGSRDADAAIDDLRSCGLPPNVSAEVISVAEVWLPPPESIKDTDRTESAYVEEIVRESREKGEKVVTEAQILAGFATGRVKAAFPNWDVTPFATYGSPGWEIVSEAERIDADLILLGAQGQSFLSRLMLGSISQRVLTEADCSVRIGRGRIDLDAGPERIIVGFDGSRGANAAVDSVATRTWHEGTEVKLVSVSEPVLPSTIGRFVTPTIKTAEHTNVSERVWIEKSAKSAIAKLHERGLEASLQVCAGNPKSVLAEEADKWGADCIFMGANAWGSRLERFLIGSTSAAVAARAHCSVEVVRAKVASIHSLTGQSEAAGASPRHSSQKR
jgi:nucleotide-binding universal stress UspA family protein